VVVFVEVSRARDYVCSARSGNGAEIGNEGCV